MEKKLSELVKELEDQNETMRKLTDCITYSSEGKYEYAKNRNGVKLISYLVDVDRKIIIDSHKLLEVYGLPDTVKFEII